MRTNIPLHERMLTSEQTLALAQLRYRLIHQLLTDADSEGRLVHDFATVADLAEHAVIPKEYVEQLATACRKQACREALGGAVPFGPSPEDLCWRSAETNGEVIPAYTRKTSARIAGEVSCMEGVLTHAEVTGSEHLPEIQQHVATVAAVPRNLLTAGDDAITGRVIAIEPTMLHIERTEGGEGILRIPMHDKSVRRKFKQSGISHGDTVTARCTGLKKSQRMYSFEAAA